MSKTEQLLHYLHLQRVDLAAILVALHFHHVPDRDDPYQDVLIHHRKVAKSFLSHSVGDRIQIILWAATNHTRGHNLTDRLRERIIGCGSCAHNVTLRKNTDNLWRHYNPMTKTEQIIQRWRDLSPADWAESEYGWILPSGKPIALTDIPTAKLPYFYRVEYRSRENGCIVGVWLNSRSQAV